jgi:hypothetical protein
MAALLLERESGTPAPAGAALANVTVQVVELPLGTVDWLQVKEETSAGARVIVAVCAGPPAEAEITAGPATVRAPTVAVKFAEVDPAAIGRVAGTVTCELLLERPIDRPPAGAAALSETVQEILPATAAVFGLQATPDTCTAGAGGDNTMDAVCWLLLAAAVMTAV